MKVPQYVSQTQPSPQGLGYISSAGATPAAFGAGIGQGLESLGIDIQAAQQKATQRTESIDRFKSLTDFSRFQTAMNDSLVEAKRTADPSGKGYVQTAEQLYDKEAANYLASVPDQLRPEFTSRVAEVKKGVIGDSLTFQYQAGDAMFRQGVDDEYQKSLKGLDPKTGGDPTQIDTYKAHMAEIIGATDLSAVEKQDLMRKVNVGLEGVGYKATYAKQLAEGGVAPASGDAIDVVTAKIIGVESGGRATAKNPNSSASGVGQFLDSTWVQTIRQHRPDLAEGRSAAQIIALKGDATLGREMTKAFTQDNAEYLTNRGVATTPGNLYLAHFLGSGGAVNVLKADPGASIESVVGQDVVRANPFLRGMTVAQTVAWSDKKMGSAPTITVDSDPAFANLPYEDRANLQRDATSEVAAAQAAAAKAEKEATAAKTNALYNGINDGVMGVTDVDAARQEGWLTDFDAIKKAQDLIKQRDETVNLRGQGLAKLIDDNAVWDPTDDKDRKMLNAVIGKDGLAKLSGGDLNYVANGVVPLVGSAHDIPTDVVGTLTGMTRSTNQQKAFFALDTLNQLQAADPTAYKARVPDDLAAKAEAYRTHKDLYPADELMGIINGGTDQQTRQANAILEKEAQSILSENKNGTSTLQTLVQGVVGSYGGVFSSPALSGVPAFARGLSLDYQTAFTDGYKKFGNQDDADAYAKKILQRSWGVTSVGGQSTLMKYPPEVTGYKPMAGSMDWIGMQVREELGLPADARFDLVSDDQTKQEFAKWQRGENFVEGSQGNQPVSYQVVTYDENNVAHLSRDRHYFVPTERDRLAETNKFEQDRRLGALQQAQSLLDYAQDLENSQGIPVPQEYKDNVAKLKSEYDSFAPPAPVKPAIPAYQVPAGAPADLSGLH